MAKTIKCKGCGKVVTSLNYEEDTSTFNSGCISAEGVEEDLGGEQGAYHYYCPKCGIELYEGGWEEDWDTLAEFVEEQAERSLWRNKQKGESLI